jgi:hypothetical protein
MTVPASYPPGNFAQICRLTAIAWLDARAVEDD